MIRPVAFSFNEETAGNNAFQLNTGSRDVQEKALGEFNHFVALLRQNGVDVIVVDDTPLPRTPDSLFPNNWVSFHDNGAVILYPMYATNRRAERKHHVLERIGHQFQIRNEIDLSFFEKKEQYLEGTGSMVLDRENAIAYACISPRTDKAVLDEFCNRMKYRSVLFSSTDMNNQPIYHTNVMMCVADRYVVICLDSIPESREKQALVDTIGATGKEIIEINFEELKHFAGNMLQIRNLQGEKLLVMSTQAYQSLGEEQIEKLSSYNRIIHSSLTTIETNGGGSARCMMAEVHLPIRENI